MYCRGCDMAHRPITMTVYLYAHEGENPHKWDVAEWLDDPTIVGWAITEGHGDDCQACAEPCSCDSCPILGWPLEPGDAEVERKV